MPVETVLTCWGNSHPFLERRINLSESVKIGRSVAQARPANNNAIFDCKVLSRNHALLWHDGGKFFLQDTKSSNGTFVNNHRLSKGSEESAPRQLSTSDILQFGVDVVENSRKVTHSCIMATVKLLDEEGNEIKNVTLDTSICTNNTFQSQEFYQLVHYLQEALHREQLLEVKLSTLQQLVLTTNESALQGWKNQINEDKLLARLDILENQLCVFNKLQPDEGLRKEVVSLQNDKLQYEIEAKDSLRTVIEEKLEISQKLCQLEILLSSKEQQVQHLESVQASMQMEFDGVLDKHKVLTEDHKKLKEEFETLHKRSEEDKTSSNNDNTDLNNKLQQLTTQNNILLNKIENLQADKDFSTQQLNNIKDKMTTMKTEGKGVLNVDKGVQAEIINLLDIKSLMNMQNDEEEEDDGSDDGDDDDKVKDKEVNDEGSHVVDKDGDDSDDDDDDDDDEKEDMNTEFEFCEKPSMVMNAGDSIKTMKKSDQKGAVIKEDICKDDKMQDSKEGHEDQSFLKDLNLKTGGGDGGRNDSFIGGGNSFIGGYNDLTDGTKTILSCLNTSNVFVDGGVRINGGKLSNGGVEGGVDGENDGTVNGVVVGDVHCPIEALLKHEGKIMTWFLRTSEDVTFCG